MRALVLDFRRGQASVGLLLFRGRNPDETPKNLFIANLLNRYSTANQHHFFLCAQTDIRQRAFPCRAIPLLLSTGRVEWPDPRTASISSFSGIQPRQLPRLRTHSKCLTLPHT